jgi:hemin uptake protein HemP
MMQQDASQMTQKKIGQEPPKQYRKEQLFGDAKEIIIQHGELAYRLRETRNGKLILNL